MRCGPHVLLLVLLACVPALAQTPDADVPAPLPAPTSSGEPAPSAVATASEPPGAVSSATAPAPSAPPPSAPPPSSTAAPVTSAPPSAAAVTPTPPVPVASPPAESPATASAPPETSRPSWGWATSIDESGAQDRGLTEDGEEVHKPRVKWKGTSFVSSHALTTSLVGVGSDFQSRSHQVYTQGYALLLNYYLHEAEGGSLRVAVTPALDVELTNSDETMEQREVVVRDLPLTVAGAVNLYSPKKSLVRTDLGLNFTTLLATSQYTRGVGDIVTLSPRATLAQTLPLAGQNAKLFQSFQLGVSLRYDHLFSDADVQVSDNVASMGDDPSTPLADTSSAGAGRVRSGRALQDGAGNTAYSDVISGVRLAPNTARVGAFVAVAERLGIPIELALGINYARAELNPAAETEVQTVTGPVQIPADEGRSARQSAGVSAGLTLFPSAEFGIALGYENSADLDGPTPNLLYTPYAMFTGALVISLDAIYERATGPARSEPFVLF